MKIYDITKCLSGNVLGIGVDIKITKLLEENDRVLNCNLLDSETVEATIGKKEKCRLHHMQYWNNKKTFENIHKRQCIYK